ncbi:MAG: bifunctional hydroxymethylpyrimidine kinase/phosphomethylpyrimidine kinase, partial [Alphaproteobacteria bacterium]
MVLSPKAYCAVRQNYNPCPGCGKVPAMQVISVQSRVAHGYVGNAAAVPAYQAAGIDAWAVDTVRLAYHPGHARAFGPPAGSKTAPDEVAAMLAGVFARVGHTPVAVHLGYLGSAETGRRVLAEIAKRRQSGVADRLIVDPVIGDDAEGRYVEEALVGFYRDEAAPLADVLLPNRFELALLTGMTVESLADAKAAALTVAPGRNSTVLVSSLPGVDGGIANLAVDADGAWMAEVPKRPLRA